MFLLGQVKGTVKDDNGDALAFASIYLEGTSSGTTSNLEGEYSFNLQPGEYSIVFQYVGYQQHVERIQIAQDEITLDIVLFPETYELGEIVISADAEDPAYAIMRKAIAKRDYYKNLIEAYSCDVYVKGNQKILDAPEKILGQEVGDLDGALDSTRQGIVYLSESLSKYYYQAPDDYKEVMISSKLSGDDNGYSFNSAHEMNMNVYDETTNLGMGRSLVSPLADNAMSYYKFKLEGAKMDRDGNLINKIKVIRKRGNDPSGDGYIYIVEDLWNVHSLDFTIVPSASQIYFLDTLRLEQVFIPMEKPDKWVSFTSKATFKLSVFGFKIYGYFIGVYKDYDLSPKFEDNFFTNELMKVEEEANKKDSTYWEDVRPIPLTIEEGVDYVRKDSIYEIRNSDAYLDSVDRANNKFKLTNLISGYSYRKQRKKLRIEFDSPLSHLGYNAVQGFNVDVKFEAFKFLNEDDTKYFLFYPKVSYGFSEKKLRADFIFNYRFNRIKHTVLGIRGGTDIVQFQENPDAIAKSWNSIYTLFFKDNYAQYYDRKRLYVYTQSEISNGIFIRTGIDFSGRSKLDNTTDYSLFRKDLESFRSNNPLSFAGTEVEHLNASIFNLSLRFRPGQKYISYPNRRFTLESKYPDFWLHLKQGLSSIWGESKFTHLATTISDQLTFGDKGNFRFYINGGVFLNKESISFIDYKHFRGNELLFSNPRDYRSGFLMLPYYTSSTNDSYLQLHFEHHFQGFFLDKLPGVSKLGWQLVAGVKHLNLAKKGSYNEYHIGIDNIGYELFRLFRIDFVYNSGEQSNFTDKFGFVIGLKL